MTSEDEIDFEMFDRMDRGGGSSKFVPFALGAIIGGAIGAALALLYAPAEGSALRRHGRRERHYSKRKIERRKIILRRLG
jgi:gas vesicle protein